MSWIAIALFSAAIIAWVNIFDKTVIHRYARSPLTLPLLIGVAQTSVGVVVLAMVRVPDGATWMAVGWGLSSGAVFGLSGQLIIRVLFHQEVSRTIPVIQSSAIFVGLIALIFLGESISAVQWVGMIATITGAALLSLQTKGRGGVLFLNRSFYLLMLGSILYAVANVTSKVALDDLPIPFTHGLRALSLGAVFLAFNLRPAPWSEVRSFFARRSPALLLVGTSELIIVNIGLFTLLWALSLGPVSLVTALWGTRALFVVFYSTAIALIWKGALGEETTVRAIVVKVSSTILIVGGVVFIAV
jgi:transporter family protein